MNSSLQYKSNANEEGKKLVNIYLRNYKKMAIVIEIETPIKNIHLKKIIATKLNTYQENLGIFANGERVDNATQKSIDLKDKSIVHIVQLDRVKAQKLTIYFKYNSEVLKVQTTPKTQIRSIIHQYIEPAFHKGQNDVFLAYTAKPINIFKTFQDELVENQCEILILDLKPSKAKKFQIINHSQYSKHGSTTSTKMVAMPMMGGRNHTSIKTQKQKIAQLNKSKFDKASSSVLEESIPDLQKQEMKSSGGKKMIDPEAAPHATPEDNAAPFVYQGFDPHSLTKTAPTFKMEQKQPNKKEPTNKANPQVQIKPDQNPFIKEKDLLFMGHMQMDESENISAGAIQESKQNFLKKKSLITGKQNKMLNHN